MPYFSVLYDKMCQLMPMARMMNRILRKMFVLTKIAQ